MNNFKQYVEIVLYTIGIKKYKSTTKYTNASDKKALLVHGLAGNWRDMGYIADHLHSEGYEIHFLKDLGNNTLNAKKSVEIFETYIHDNNLNKLLVIGHSKGGIICRIALQDKKTSNKVRKLITISTPHGGTFLSHIYPRELRPGSEILNISSDNTNVTNIYSSFDELVIPNSNLRLKNADNNMISDKGHTRSIYSPETIDIISRHI